MAELVDPCITVNQTSQFERMLLCKEAQTIDSRPDAIMLPVHLVRELVVATHAMYEKKGEA